MSLLRERVLLREYLALLFEDIAADAENAKIAYEKAQDDLVKWQQARGTSPLVKGDLATKKKLEKQLEKAKKEFGKFEPDVGDLEFKLQTRTIEPKVPEVGRGYLNIESVEPLTWYRWSSFPPQAYVDDKGQIPWRGRAKNARPGEEWLASVLGAQQQGDAISFDLVTHDQRAWEVKDIEDGQIRPGKLGREAFQEAAYQLTTLTKQLAKFKQVVEQMGADRLLNGDLEARRWNAIVMYLDSKFDKVMSGEISRGTIREFRLACIAAARLREAWDEKGPSVEKRMGDKVKTVPRNRYIHQQLVNFDMDGDEDNLTGLTDREKAYGRLMGTIFDDHTKVDDWIRSWISTIDSKKIFPVAGVFVVIESVGFYLIPFESLNDVLQFERTSKGEPRFSLHKPGTTESIIPD